VEYHLDAIAEKVFIADGAKWIWKWAEANYPAAIHNGSVNFRTINKGM
jgi:hypothetical protein